MRACRFREQGDSSLLMRILLILYSACLDFVPLLSRFCLSKPSDIDPMKWHARILWAAAWLLPGWLLSVQTPMESACAPVHELLFSISIQFFLGSLMIKKFCVLTVRFFNIFSCFHNFVSYPSNVHTSVSRNCKNYHPYRCWIYWFFLVLSSYGG